MTDVFTKQKRSEVMSRIRGKGNKDTELVMIRILRKYHIVGWRRNQHILGRPDFIFPKQKVALFVDGCFWHVCPKHFNLPKNNRAFWEQKLQTNQDRDKYVTKTLRQAQWKVVRVWEHELSNSETVVRRILAALQSGGDLIAH